MRDRFTEPQKPKLWARRIKPKPKADVLASDLLPVSVFEKHVHHLILNLLLFRIKTSTGNKRLSISFSIILLMGNIGTNWIDLGSCFLASYKATCYNAVQEGVVQRKGASYSCGRS
jgi:hypothetical protein